jgi:hypothetical protein
MDTENLKESLNRVGDKLYDFGSAHMTIVFMGVGLCAGWAIGKLLPTIFLALPVAVAVIGLVLALWAHRTPNQ